MGAKRSSARLLPADLVAPVRLCLPIRHKIHEARLAPADLVAPVHLCLPIRHKIHEASRDWPRPCAGGSCGPCAPMPADPPQDPRGSPLASGRVTALSPPAPG